MNRLIEIGLSFLLLVLRVEMAAAKPYFRPLDLNHPQISMGQFGNLANGKTADGGMLALITHSPTDGCIVSGICLDWTPLAIGGAWNSQQFNGSYLALGPSANLVPAAKSILLILVDAVTKDGQLENIKELLEPPILGTPDLTFAAGVNYGPVFAQGSKPQWLLTRFIGGAWHF